MNTKTVDALILIPLIPVLPVLATWWLPWERWLGGKIPKYILGPYILYGSFAAWHFRLDWWSVALGVVWGASVSVMAIIDATRKS